MYQTVIYKSNRRVWAQVYADQGAQQNDARRLAREWKGKADTWWMGPVVRAVYPKLTITQGM